eukprot:Phypoly_transcript_23688.p1 GENE.Phypoly_transcript_23688~~Phypoly_transcript_23688.p1  ORF type:complete len:183 (+),score=26.93 Phypoly_transcript_23688:51-551(+)
MGVITAVLWMAVVGLVSGHICMWEPHQRGPVDISYGGNPTCYHLYAPCGGKNNSIPPGPPVVSLKAGSPYAVEFQQNLNHWYAPKPGFMMAEIALSENGVFVPFGEIIPDFNAGDMVTQTNFTIKGIVPNYPCAACVLRVQYVSNNPGEGEGSNIFYQCADISIVQ